MTSSDGESATEFVGHYARTLTSEEIETLKKHDSSLVSEFKRNKLEVEAAKNWDLFYKRNKTNFYKDRHWTLREFEELSGIVDGEKKVDSTIQGDIDKNIFSNHKLKFDNFQNNPFLKMPSLHVPCSHCKRK